MLVEKPFDARSRNILYYLRLRLLMNHRDMWIKAAVEHVTLELAYYSGRTKKELSIREVEPDYFGWDRLRCFGFHGISRKGKRGRFFKEDSVIKLTYSGDLFTPNPRGRWKELVPIYERRNLDKINW